MPFSLILDPNELGILRKMAQRENTSVASVIRRAWHTVIFKSHPEGLPTPDNFEIATPETPALEDGQFLLENVYLSLDPYMRMLMGGGWTYSGPGMSPGDLMVGRVLGKVIETKNPEFAPGDHVVGRLGWQTHAISDGKDLD